MTPPDFTDDVECLLALASASKKALCSEDICCRLLPRLAPTLEFPYCELLLPFFLAPTVARTTVGNAAAPTPIFRKRRKAATVAAPMATSWPRGRTANPPLLITHSCSNTCFITRRLSGFPANMPINKSLASGLRSSHLFK